METYIYADVLLAINYIVNTLLLLSTAKLTGRRLGRGRAVAAALLGACGSLAIFLPFFGFWLSLAAKVLLSSLIIRLAFPYIGLGPFARALFVFFAASFFFAGVMLAVFTICSPEGMIYYNGAVYYDLSSVTLLLTTAVAYLLLGLWRRFSRAGRIAVEIREAEISFRGNSVTLPALVDSGNGLVEPFSGVPVMLCGARDLAALFPDGVTERILAGGHMSDGLHRLGVPFRLVPYRGVGAAGAVAAFRPDLLLLRRKGETLRTESVYIGLLPDAPKGEGYRALLNPDIVGVSVPVKKQRLSDSKAV